ncbi:hypothetical protein E2K93_07615 [Thalassotalea sp. HSM 43]|uniref:hypothetical protein n=1 Tax=Thalassotalea sp. HSM 43 TaxID=2552945 RepID=UPI00108129D7|nr:hypothetical protein [Thalassotalea sp. HSM 43]QBY04263.1 hypothetical protein E2K93_07615 [Thalassotalea sp. HSM 43]
MKQLRLLPLVLLFVAGHSTASVGKQRIEINTTKIVKSLQQPLVGENVNFLMSSDTHWPRKVSMQQRIGEMKLGMLRFPYGHLADNYLFTDAPFNDGADGLTPRVVSRGTAPGNYPWAVDDKGYFKKSLDFDEFVRYCQSLQIEPLVMVNMLGWQKSDSVVDFDDLKQHAIEWVRYANITRNYNIKYWQLGNEVAMHVDKSTYFKHFVEIAQAMKQVDPSIHIGFGEDGRSNWIAEALNNEDIGQYIDFLSPHQYLFGRAWSESYLRWRNYNGKITSKIDKLQRYADNSTHHKQVPLIITEYGVTGGDYPESKPKGYALFRSAQKNSNASMILSADKTFVTKYWGKGINNHAIHIKLLKDGDFVLRPYGCDGCFITAGENADSELQIAETFSDKARFQIIKAGKEHYRVKSVAFANRFIAFNYDNNRFNLSASKANKGEQFNIVDLDKKPKLYANADEAHIDQGMNYANDLWKSLLFAEMTLTTHNFKNVSHMIHWNTHSSWDGEFGGFHGLLANSLNNTAENTLTPIGEVIKLINNHSLSEVIQLPEKHGFVRSYATLSKDKSQMSIALINKNYHAEAVQIDLTDFNHDGQFQQWVYTGEHPEDEFPTVYFDELKGDKKLSNRQQLQMQLSPLSLTIIKLKAQ